ncbi:MAG: hypothetical protein KF784_14360 [Fimbriimonadaceae bacterium]|nr:hypothetical protein [Fimbriimonadaceae bacterium]
MSTPPKLKNPILEELIELRIRGGMAADVYEVANRLLCMGYETPTLYHLATHREMNRAEIEPYLQRLCEEFNAPKIDSPTALSRTRDKLAWKVACGEIDVWQATRSFASASYGQEQSELREEALYLEDLLERCSWDHPHYKRKLVPWCEEQIALYWKEHAPMPEFEV